VGDLGDREEFSLAEFIASFDIKDITWATGVRPREAHLE